MKQMCSACLGSGTVKCIADKCFGKGSFIGVNFEVVVCIVCGGKGKTKCSRCRGAGQIDVAVPVPPNGGDDNDPLVGTWVDDKNASCMTFTRHDNSYLVSFQTAQMSGKGAATKLDNAVEV